MKNHNYLLPWFIIAMVFAFIIMTEPPKPQLKPTPPPPNLKPYHIYIINNECGYELVVEEKKALLLQRMAEGRPPITREDILKK